MLPNGKAKLPGYNLRIISFALMLIPNLNFRPASRSASAACYPALLRQKSCRQSNDEQNVPIVYWDVGFIGVGRRYYGKKIQMPRRIEKTNNRKKNRHPPNINNAKPRTRYCSSLITCLYMKNKSFLEFGNAIASGQRYSDITHQCRASGMGVRLTARN